MQYAPYGPPTPTPVVVNPGARIISLLTVIAIFLGALLAVNLYDARQAQKSDQTRAGLQVASDLSDSVLSDIEANFTKSVFNTSTTDSAPKQQVTELEYIFEMQVLIAHQNKALLQAALNK